MSDDYEYIDTRIEDDVYRITLDRPDTYNALSAPGFEEIESALDEAEKNSDVRVILLTGRGEAFSAGGDIEQMRERIDDEGRQKLDYWIENYLVGSDYIDTILNLRKPLVTRINGDAAGVGATLATMADISVASEEARIGDTHVNVGLVVPNALAHWPLLVGLGKARELLLNGELISAREADEIGLINYAVPDDELDETVNDVIAELASKPQPTLQFTKFLLNNWIKFANQSIFGQGPIALETISSQLPDHQEFTDAFLSNREPDYPTARDR